MDVFEVRKAVMKNYQSFIESFINISDEQIRNKVAAELSSGKLWPNPLIQFNPSFEEHSDIDELVESGVLHPDMRNIFQGYRLYRHQVDALKLGSESKDFVVTSGTGSGKSLTYIGTIFNYLLDLPDKEKGIKAIIVYPMNALINSQTKEFQGYEKNYRNATGKPFPISYAQYTGQEKDAQRQKVIEELPDILLTNYMMLELLLTRIRERRIRDSLYKSLRYLVFDELHTYRGRQGADIGLLIRRIKAKSINRLLCIGTSATMVSGGSNTEQKSAVARVASILFGKSFEPTQVVQETLRRCFRFNGNVPSKNELRECLSKSINMNDGAESLRSHETAIWLENRIALKEMDGNLIRRKPCRLVEMVETLSEDSGGNQDKCFEHLNQLLKWISAVNLKNDSRYTFLPFRLHQFISQTGSVYTTLEQNEKRAISLEPGPFKVLGKMKRPLYPNVFSRASGHPFICVRKNRDTGTLEPREFRMGSDEGDENPDYGYLIAGNDVWDPKGDMEQLPDTWLNFNKRGEITTIRKRYRSRIPKPIFYDEEGFFSHEEPMKYSAWYMPAPLLFDPTGGTFFDTKTSEGTKLARLGSEGRSSSTTLLSLLLLRELAQSGMAYQDQKLLSFTDNRQDAALQAGHFNDFLDVVQLRAAIYRALKNAPSQSLTYKNLGKAIFDSLGLPILEYANTETEPVPWKARKYEEIFQKYLVYRALYDLRRGWRVNVPNLEQCALMSISYENLDDASGYEPLWKDIPIISELPVKARKDFLYQILEFFRQSYALHSEVYLAPHVIDENHKEILENLKAPWKFDQKENIPQTAFMRNETLHERSRIFSASTGANSRMGKYIRWFVAGKYPTLEFKTVQYQAFMDVLLHKLEQADFLFSTRARNRDNQEIRVYQLRLSTVVWRLGDKKTVRPDILKSRAYKPIQIFPNQFFQALYQTDFARLKRLRAEDHTGQLQNDDRRQREMDFGEGKISALYCSPTMELGIDIKELNTVHMRNAPPNPANYAQRSGRAGRSGQAALVFTYCSSFSPHDRHYFKEQIELVSGVVAPPRIDLSNEELLKTHLNALYLSEVGLPELDYSVEQLVESGSGNLPLTEKVKAKLKIGDDQYTRIRAAFEKVISDFESRLKSSASSWFADQWAERTIHSFVSHFDQAIDRWRNLYVSAQRLLESATRRLSGGLLASGSREFKQETLNMLQATRQLELLRNAGVKSRQLSEFYPYRYFAAEGFLPGYNFTRLPLRTFVRMGDGGEFISRPRTIALREFGPQNIIYHKGKKYQINQMIVQDALNHVQKAKVCISSGFFLTGDRFEASECPLTHVSLEDNSKKDFIMNLLEMSETRCDETSRISCEEEERLSRGYQIDTYFAIDGELSGITKAVITGGGQPFINLTYIPAARIYYVNQRWRSRNEEGFTMGMTTGIWYKNAALENRAPESETIRNVKLFSSDTADALYLEPTKPLGLSREGVITLQYALRRAIENRFQVEPREISATAMGSPQMPNIFLYEASEGSLGILSQFVNDPKVFADVIEEAISVCRYEDDEYAEPASYDDLLSYYNQRDHPIIDRWLIKDALEKLKSLRS